MSAAFATVKGPRLSHRDRVTFASTSHPLPVPVRVIDTAPAGVPPGRQAKFSEGQPLPSNASPGSAGAPGPTPSDLKKHTGSLIVAAGGGDPWDDTIIQRPTGLDRRFISAPRWPWPPDAGSEDPVSESAPPGPYNQDGLISIQNHDFMESPTFKAAYQRGVAAAGTDYSWHWRVRIGLWAAAIAWKLPGHFVECGVKPRLPELGDHAVSLLGSSRETALLSRYVQGHRRALRIGREACQRDNGKEQSGNRFWFLRRGSSVRANFSEWKNIRIIEGAIPKTLQWHMTSKK